MGDVLAHLFFIFCVILLLCTRPLQSISVHSVFSPVLFSLVCCGVASSCAVWPSFCVWRGVSPRPTGRSAQQCRGDSPGCDELCQAYLPYCGYPGSRHRWAMLWQFLVSYSLREDVHLQGKKKSIELGTRVVIRRSVRFMNHSRKGTSYVCVVRATVTFFCLPEKFGIGALRLWFVIATRVWSRGVEFCILMCTVVLFVCIACLLRNLVHPAGYISQVSCHHDGMCSFYIQPVVHWEWSGFFHVYDEHFCASIIQAHQQCISLMKVWVKYLFWVSKMCPMLWLLNLNGVSVKATCFLQCNLPFCLNK